MYGVQECLIVFSCFWSINMLNDTRSVGNLCPFYQEKITTNAHHGRQVASRYFGRPGSAADKAEVLKYDFRYLATSLSAITCSKVIELVGS